MNRQTRWFLIFVGFIALVMIGVVANPQWREQVRRAMVNQSYQVLASAEGDLLNNGSHAKVLKFKSGHEIFVEVIEVREDGSDRIVDRLLLPDPHDGLFNYQGHVSRLAIVDVDNDGKMELIAPTFDQSLVPHLNVFKFNPATGHFEPFHP